MAAPAIESVQCFGRKKTAVAVTYCKRGRGLIKINGCPIELVEPEILRFKAYEPILLLGTTPFRWSRHAHSRQGWWSHLSDLRHSPEHSQSSGRFLPKICR
ncbi:unnamed protein product [Prunus armeniaca]|uniref:40S ribosomal protein S16 n=1 Tax=Prunus armeniaca TaxID=36596 RepID=A0A6J5VS98_PRUAR|nr:unnamed protein product [Prunus armeniaca]